MALTMEKNLIIATLPILSLWASKSVSRTLPEPSMSERPEKWMSQYKRVYKDSTEKETRFNIFKKNVNFIESFNKDGNRPYKLAVNHFADMTSETGLLNAVANQPVSVTIDAGESAFSSGVFTGECGTDLDHGVTAVGYRTSNGTKHWLVKNSWGMSWGEEGYIRMQRDVDAKEGLCGIAMDASYPTA